MEKDWDRRTFLKLLVGQIVAVPIAGIHQKATQVLEKKFRETTKADSN